MYETIEEINNNKQKGKKTEKLSFKKNCKEINELHLAFNDFARIMILSQSI